MSKSALDWKILAKCSFSYNGIIFKITVSQDEKPLKTCMQYIFYLNNQEATYVIIQGYNTVIRRISIDKDSMSEFFDTNLRVFIIQLVTCKI